jgi:hypothetical protein
MLRISIASRRGNLVLAVFGSVAAVASLVILILFIADVGTAAGPLDLVLQAALVASLVCSVWLVLNALLNLGIDWHPRRSASVEAHPATGRGTS